MSRAVRLHVLIRRGSAPDPDSVAHGDPFAPLRSLARPCVMCVALLAVVASTARGETPAAFGRRCIPADCVAPPSNIPDILGRRAAPPGSPRRGLCAVGWIGGGPRRPRCDAGLSPRAASLPEKARKGSNIAPVA